MAKKKERIENPKVREYIYDLIPKKANSNPLFVKVYGKGFAKRQIRKELLTLYTDEPVGAENYAGYHTSGDKSITLCKSEYQSRKDLLTPRDIETSKALQETVVHESVHAILERSKRECKKSDLTTGTGLLERYNSGAELGRGLNEGFTEWMCEQFGYESRCYKELLNFVKLIEVSIGTEKTMELGKGNIKDRFPEILGIPHEQVCVLLAKSDSLYTANKQLTIFNGLKNFLDRKLHHASEYSQESIDEDDKKYGPYIEGCIKFKGYLDYLDKNNLDISEETIYQWLKDSYIPYQESARAKSIIDFESQILDTYFMKDIERVLKSGKNISREDYLKCKKIISLLATEYTIPNDVKQSKDKYSSLVVKDKFEQLSKVCIEKFALEDALKYKKGQLSFSKFIETTQALYTNQGDEIKHFKAFFDVVTPDCSLKMTELCLYLSQGLRRSEERGKEDKEEFLREIDTISDATVYGITDRDGFSSGAIIWGREGIYTSQFSRQTSTVKSEGQQGFFDLTDTGQYPTIIANFDKIKRQAFEKNPNSKIHIVSEEIVVESGNKCTFYHICKSGKIVPMLSDSQVNLQFASRSREEARDSKLVPVTETSVGIFATLANAIKKGLHRMSNGKNPSKPNYIEENEEVPGKIQFSHKIPESDGTIDSYRVEDFDERLKTTRDGKTQTSSETKDVTIDESQSGRDDN